MIVVNQHNHESLNRINQFENLRIEMSESFPKEFWNNKLGTWKLLSEVSFNKTKIKSNIESLYELLTTNSTSREKISLWLNTLFEDEQDPEIGQICLEVFINPTIRAGSIKKAINSDNINLKRTIDRLVKIGLLDSTWEGKAKHEKKMPGKILASRITPDFSLYQLLCGNFAVKNSINNHDLWGHLKKRIDVILIWIEDEHGMPLLVKNKSNSPIDYLKGRWSLPYFFVTKKSHMQEDTEKLSAEVINEIKEKIGMYISELSENSTQAVRDSKLLMYLPPLHKGGNPLFLLDARIDKSMDCIKNIKKFMNDNIQYKINKSDDQRSLESWWDSFSNGKEKFHYGTVLSMAHMLITENQTKKSSEEIKMKLKEFLKEYPREDQDTNYFDLVNDSNLGRRLFGIEN